MGSQRVGHNWATNTFSPILYQNCLFFFFIPLYISFMRTGTFLFGLSLWFQYLECQTDRKRCCCCCCWLASVVSDSVVRWQPTRLPRPWDSPCKNIGVGCHFLLQCMKVKTEREVAQSCPTPSNPMNRSLPGSSIHGILQARVLEWGAIAFSKEEVL